MKAGIVPLREFANSHLIQQNVNNSPFRYHFSFKRKKTFTNILSSLSKVPSSDGMGPVREFALKALGNK